MELEGLQRVLHFLQQQCLSIQALVTDRHKQINKWLRERCPTIIHYYDVFGMLLRVRTMFNVQEYCVFILYFSLVGFRKKLEAAAKQKDCEIIGSWQRSIIKHLYWCVSSTPNGDNKVILAKWLSLENHVHNKHRHKDKKFPKCAHGKLRGQERKKKWFKRRKWLNTNIIAHKSHYTLLFSDSKASEKLPSLLTNSYLCKDICRLSPSYQTSSLEAFHSVIIHFAPKYVPFSYHGMNCR